MGPPCSCAQPPYSFFGAYTGANDTPIKRGIVHLKESIELLVSEADTLAGSRPVQWTEPRRYVQ